MVQVSPQNTNQSPSVTGGVLLEDKPAVNYKGGASSLLTRSVRIAVKKLQSQEKQTFKVAKPTLPILFVFTATLNILYVLWFTFYNVNSPILSYTVNQEKNTGSKKMPHAKEAGQHGRWQQSDGLGGLHGIFSRTTLHAVVLSFPWCFPLEEG